MMINEVSDQKISIRDEQDDADEFSSDTSSEFSSDEGEMPDFDEISEESEIRLEDQANLQEFWKPYNRQNKLANLVIEFEKKQPPTALKKLKEPIQFFSLYIDEVKYFIFYRLMICLQDIIKYTQYMVYSFQSPNTLLSYINKQIKDSLSKQKFPKKSKTTVQNFCITAFLPQQIFIPYSTSGLNYTINISTPMDLFYQSLTKTFNLPTDPTDFQECCRQLQLALDQIQDQFSSFLILSMSYSESPSEFLHKLLSNSPFCETKGQRYLCYSLTQAIIELLPNDLHLFAQGIYDLFTCYDSSYEYNLNHMKDFLLQTLLPNYSKVCNSFSDLSFISIEQNYFDFDMSLIQNLEVVQQPTEIICSPKKDKKDYIEGFYEDLESFSKIQEKFNKNNPISLVNNNETQIHAQDQSFEFSSTLNTHQISENQSSPFNQNIHNISLPFFEQQEIDQIIDLPPTSLPLLDQSLHQALSLSQSIIKDIHQDDLPKQQSPLIQKSSSQQQFNQIQKQYSNNNQSIYNSHYELQSEFNQQQPTIDPSLQVDYYVHQFLDCLTLPQDFDMPSHQQNDLVPKESYSDQTPILPFSLSSSFDTSLNSNTNQCSQDTSLYFKDQVNLNLQLLTPELDIYQEDTLQLDKYDGEQVLIPSQPSCFEHDQQNAPPSLNNNIKSQSQDKNYFSVNQNNSLSNQTSYQFTFSQYNIQDLSLVQLMEQSIFPTNFNTAVNIVYSVIYSYLLQNKYSQSPYTYLQVLTQIPISELNASFNLAVSNQEIHQLKLKYGLIQLSELISNYLPMQHLFKNFFYRYIEMLQQYPLKIAYFHLMNMQYDQLLPHVPNFHRSRYKNFDIEDNQKQQLMIINNDCSKKFIDPYPPPNFFSISKVPQYQTKHKFNCSFNHQLTGNQLNNTLNQSLQLITQVH